MVSQPSRKVYGGVNESRGGIDGLNEESIVVHG